MLTFHKDLVFYLGCLSSRAGKSTGHSRLLWSKPSPTGLHLVHYTGPLHTTTLPLPLCLVILRRAPTLLALTWFGRPDQQMRAPCIGDHGAQYPHVLTAPFYNGPTPSRRSTHHTRDANRTRGLGGRGGKEGGGEGPV